MVETKMLTIGPVSSIWLISLNNPKLLFSEMCNSLSGWWCSLMFQIKYRTEIVSVVFYWAFCKSIVFCWKTHCTLTRKEGLVVVFSLGYSPTVAAENRAKRLQPFVNSPISICGLSPMGFTKCQIKHDRNCISLRYLIWNTNEHHPPRLGWF